MKKLIVGLLGLLLTGSAFGVPFTSIRGSIKNHEIAVIYQSTQPQKLTLYCELEADQSNGAAGYVDGINISLRPRSFGVQTPPWNHGQTFRFSTYKPLGVLRLYNRTPGPTEGGWKVSIYYYCHL